MFLGVDNLVRCLPSIHVTVSPPVRSQVLSTVPATLMEAQLRRLCDLKCQLEADPPDFAVSSLAFDETQQIVSLPIKDSSLQLGRSTWEVCEF